MSWRDKYCSPEIGVSLILNPIHWAILPYGVATDYELRVGWLFLEIELVVAPPLKEMADKLGVKIVDEEED